MFEFRHLYTSDWMIYGASYSLTLKDTISSIDQARSKRPNVQSYYSRAWRRGSAAQG